MTAITKSRAAHAASLVGHGLLCILSFVGTVLRIALLVAVKFGGFLLALAAGATAAWMRLSFDHS